MSKSITIYTAQNFKDLESKSMLVEEVTDYCSLNEAILDDRTGVFSGHNNFSDLQWYYNYLELTSYFARRNPDSYATYLLDLGYIPIVYLPSFAQSIAPKLLSKLQVSGIPFIQHKSTSFVLSYYNSDTMDAWVSKIDIRKHLGIDFEQATSAEVARRIFES